jgi:hypothetical protein
VEAGLDVDRLRRASSASQCRADIRGLCIPERALSPAS